MCVRVEPVHPLALESLFPCRLTFSDVPNYSPRNKLNPSIFYQKIYDDDM